MQRYYRDYLIFSYLSSKKFFADAFNSFYIFLPSASFALNITYKLIDQGILEYFGSTGIYSFLESLFKRLHEIETTLLIYRSFIFVIFAVGLYIAYLFSQSIIILFILLWVLNTSSVTNNIND